MKIAIFNMTYSKQMAKEPQRYKTRSCATTPRTFDIILGGFACACGTCFHPLPRVILHAAQKMSAFLHYFFSGSFIKILMIISLVVFINPSYASTNNLLYDIRTAIRYALVHSPTIRAAKSTLTVSELNLKNQFVTFLPTVSAASSHSAAQTWPDNTSDVITSSISVNMAENLYDNGRSINQYKQSKIQHQAAQIRYIHTRDQLIRTTTLSFLNLSLQKELYTVQKANLLIYQKQYDLALLKYKNGLATQRDVLRFDNQRQRAQISALQSANQITLAKNSLLITLGIDPEAQIGKKIKFKTVSLKPINIKKMPIKIPSLSRQYEYKDFLLQKKIIVLNNELAQRNILPQVDLSASANYGAGGKAGFFGAIKCNQKNLNASINLEFKYQVLDWGTSRRNLLITNEQGWQTLNNLKQQLLNIQQELTNLMLNMEQHKMSYQISKKLINSEQKSYNDVERQYQRGMVAYLDLINAIADLSSVKTQNMTDRYTLENDLYKYYYYQGVIYEKIFK